MADTFVSSAPTQAAAVAEQSASHRATFILRTYSHLLGAILGFVAIEAALFASGLADPLAQAMLSVPWLAILGAFVIVGWIASGVAHRARSLGTQYLALVGFTLAEALIFVPLLYIAANFAPGVITTAALVTIIAFCGLTWIAFSTRKDFTFLGGLVRWGLICALVLIVASLIFGWNLGTWFSVGMIALAGGAILYDTSKVLHHYSEDRYVAASLELFASFALMLWYVISLFLSRD